ncbi:hypothetical protein [Streptomyces sp. NPDC126499]|uniref:hypothetical protein n=1 Tax=Streptomyces sp. NPDC126499 TaxID=3155314 RepID=UPI00331D16E2
MNEEITPQDRQAPQDAQDRQVPQDSQDRQVPQERPAEPLADVPPVQGPGRGRRLLSVVLPAVLVLGAVGGGITYTAVTVSGADRSAETIAWADPPAGAADKAPEKDPAEAALRGRASTPMSRLLLPAPNGFRLGPDAESYGNDGELGEKEAVALLKSDARGLSGKKRRDYEKRIDRLGVQGIAVRSYSTLSNDLVVEVQIVRMKNKKRIHDLHEVKQDIAEIFEFPKGPKIEGHKNASCFLLPDLDDEEEDDKKKEKAELGGMSCSAYDSELLVSVRAYGAAPFEKSSVADLLKKQLDHIKTPGEYV